MPARMTYTNTSFQLNEGGDGVSHRLSLQPPRRIPHSLHDELIREGPIDLFFQENIGYGDKAVQVVGTASRPFRAVVLLRRATTPGPNFFLAPAPPI